MAKIQYKIKMMSPQIESSLIVHPKHLSMNEQPKTIDNIGLINHINDPRLLSNGWDSVNVVTQDKNKIAIYNNTYIKNKHRIIPTLNGPVMALSNQTILDTNEFKASIGLEPVLGVESIGTGSMSKCFTFKRTNNKVEIKQEYKYVHVDTIDDKLDKNSFTEMYDSEAFFTVINHKAPIPVSKFKYSDIEFELIDYLNASFNYNYLLNKYSITLDNFIHMCDFISLDEMFVSESIFEEYGMWINTHYFPIYKHTTIIAKYVNDITDEVVLQQINASNTNRVKTVGGNIFIDKTIKPASNNNNRLKGFYVFYGVIPGLYVMPQEPSIYLHDIVDNRKELSYIGINDDDINNNITISHQLLSLTLGVHTSSEFTKVIMMNNTNNFFLEPSSNIEINKQITQANEKVWFKNEQTNKIELSSLTHFIDLIEPVDVRSNGTVVIDGPNVISETAAVYGAFKHGNIIRFTLCSLSLNAIEQSSDLFDEAQGFEQGELKTYNTITYYTTQGNNTLPPITNNKLSISIKPIDIGYEIILPAWADPNTIVVKEIQGDKTYQFTDWKFIGPDIIILDKDKVKNNNVYNITFEFIIHPIIYSVNVLNGEVAMQILKDPQSTYGDFRGFFLLKSKNVSIKIGSVDKDTGHTQYYNQSISLDLHIEHDFIKRMTTGTKTLIL